MARSEGKAFFDSEGVAHNTPAFEKRKKRARLKNKAATRARAKARKKK